MAPHLVYMEAMRLHSILEGMEVVCPDIHRHHRLDTVCPHHQGTECHHHVQLRVV